VSKEAAILAIDAALESDESNAPLVAAELLCRKAEILDACRSLDWPSAVDGRWVPNVGQKTKLLLVDALITVTITSPSNENALRSLAVRLYGIWSGDPDGNVKSCIGKLIEAFVPHLEQYRCDRRWHPRTGLSTVTEHVASLSSPHADDRTGGAGPRSGR